MMPYEYNNPKLYRRRNFNPRRVRCVFLFVSRRHPHPQLQEVRHAIRQPRGPLSVPDQPAFIRVLVAHRTLREVAVQAVAFEKANF